MSSESTIPTLAADAAPPAGAGEGAGGPAPRPGRLRELLGIDPRSLALFRLGLGCMLITDLVKRSLTFVEHYTGAGAFPREAALQFRPDARLFHLYLSSDSPGVQATLFGIQGLLALGVLFGFRTRLATLGAVYMWCSLVRRNPLALHTGDVYLQALLFWSLFLPLGARCSLDRRAGRAPRLPDGPYLSFGTAAVLLQIAVFYFAAGYLKHQHAPWREGDALWVFTQIMGYTRSFGSALGELPWLCTLLTYATLALEGLGPFLLFSPWRTARMRVLVILALVGFHLGIQLSVYIGIFELLSIVALALFLPGSSWGALERRARGRRLTPLLRPFAARESVGAAPARGRLATWLPAGVILPALGVMLAGNLNSFSVGDPPLPLPAAVNLAARPLGLVQNWDIFTDLENQFVGWFLLVGQDQEGRLMDLIPGREFTGIVKPERFAQVFANHNSRRFWGQMALEQNAFALPYFLAYQARRWEQRHGTRLLRVALWNVGHNALQRSPDNEVRFIGALNTGRGESGLDSARRTRLEQEWQGFLANFPRRFRESDPQAVALAERVLERMGGRAGWERTRHLHWIHDGRREHFWDKQTDDVRIENQGLVLLMNLRSGRGHAFRDGAEVAPGELEGLLAQGRAWWINDSYWVFMPWKLRDPGVTLIYRGVVSGLPGGLEAEALELSFAGVGLSSRNRYLVYVGRESGLVEYWSYFPDGRSAEPAFTRSWGEWRDFGPIWLATRGGSESDLALAVYDELPAALYTDPGFDTRSR